MVLEYNDSGGECQATIVDELKHTHTHVTLQQKI